MKKSIDVAHKILNEIDASASLITEVRIHNEIEFHLLNTVGVASLIEKIQQLAKGTGVVTRTFLSP